MNQPPLNPDAPRRGYISHGAGLNADCNAYYSPGRHSFPAPTRIDKAIQAYLAAAKPVVNSVPGVYDIGSPEPEGVDYVVECDEHGVATDYLCSDAFSGYWSKTTDGTQWNGYQDGKVYMSWAELVRRVGPVKAVNDA